MKKQETFECSNCGAEVPEDAVKCPGCGISFEEEIDEEMETFTCSNCGTVVPSDVESCPMCGLTFLDEENEEEETEKEKIDPEEMFEEYQLFLPKEDYKFFLKGNRGRNLFVYEDRVVIITTVGLGSIFTDNSSDGMKVLFYKDIIGIQFKPAFFRIGYLQFETATAQMNQNKSNYFAENTFTFDSNEGLVAIYDYIMEQIAKFKK